MQHRAKRKTVLKSLTALVLILMMMTAVLFISPVSVRAANIIDMGDYIFQVLDDGKSAKILQYKGQSLYVSLPASVEDYTVTVVGASAFMDNETIKELDISNKVTTIESNAFYNCDALQKLVVPGNVLDIGECAFADCKSLESVTINDGTKNIGRFAFSGCTSLSELTLPGSIDIVDDFAFFNCRSLKNIDIPRSVSEVGGYVLEGTQWMAEQKDEFIIAGDGVLIKYNGKEKSKSIPSNIKRIGDYAFAENNDIDTILIADNVTKIGKKAFYNCKGLKTIGFSSYGMNNILDYAFSGCEQLDSVTLPGSLKTLGAGAFKDCKGLSQINIPSGVENIEENTFEKCSSLKSVKMQDGLAEIKPSSFSECTSLGKVSFPETLKTLDTAAFVKCSSLTRAEFNGDAEIQTNAFLDCKNIQELVFYKPVTNIHDMAFSGDPQLTLYSDNDVYIEDYAKRNKLFVENVRNLKPYVDQGVMEQDAEKENSGFSGSYTFIMIAIIIVDVGLVVLFSLYILFIQPKKKGRVKRKKALADNENIKSRGVKEKRFKRHEKFVEISPEETIIYAPPRQNINTEKHTSVHKKNVGNVSGNIRRKSPEKMPKRSDRNDKK